MVYVDDIQQGTANVDEKPGIVDAGSIEKGSLDVSVAPQDPS